MGGSLKSGNAAILKRSTTRDSRYGEREPEGLPASEQWRDSPNLGMNRFAYQ